MHTIASIFITSLLCITSQGFAPSYPSTQHGAVLLQQQTSPSEEAPINEENGVTQDRRSMVSSMATIGLASVFGASGLMDPPSVQAAVSSPKKKPRTYFKGKVVIKGDDGASNNDYKAVYVSARPKNPVSIPPEVQRSARGGVPAVFFAAIPNPKSFPVDFTLTENDITPEGDFGLTSDPYWWAEDVEWEISARVDSDGAVRTLDAEDLVGRTVTSEPGETSPDTKIVVSVKERGFFGSYFQTKA